MDIIWDKLPSNCQRFHEKSLDIRFISFSHQLTSKKEIRVARAYGLLARVQGWIELDLELILGVELELYRWVSSTDIYIHGTKILPEAEAHGKRAYCSEDLKLKVGYDSAVRLGWASLWAVAESLLRGSVVPVIGTSEFEEYRRDDQFSSGNKLAQLLSFTHQKSQHLLSLIGL
ncbi:hypothetical protein C5167_015264 [Papaver somniferum]|uniref:Uncharacterized protein n=1 Tax=Papaver somniferum TaxID=3469 RepID=A0A4Y7J9F2_PAPSO|nr:hypothetical protein C5167_015264 [Papaver somniferum]